MPVDFTSTAFQRVFDKLLRESGLSSIPNEAINHHNGYLIDRWPSLGPRQRSRLPSGTIVDRSNLSMGRLSHTVMVVLAGFLLATPALAQSVTWRPTADGPSWATANDLQLCLRIRKSILQDDKLSQHIIGVTVRNQVATLWGDVPSREISQRAVDRVRAVIGVARVQNELHVGSDAERDERLVTQPPTPFRLTPSESPANGPRLSSPSTDKSLPAKEKTQSAVALVWRPASVQQSIPHGPPVGKPAESRPNQEALHIAPMHLAPVPAPAQPGPSDEVVALPPIRLPLSEAQVLDRPARTVGSASRAEQDRVVRSIEALCRREPRFRLLGYRVVDCDVYVRTNRPYSAIQLEFARAIAELAGVRRVIMDDATQ
jgi:hypothetical protein